jgi:hypothetical protein
MRKMDECFFATTQQRQKRFPPTLPRPPQTKQKQKQKQSKEIVWSLVDLTRPYLEDGGEEGDAGVRHLLGWMDGCGWMDVDVDGWMGGWVDGWTERGRVCLVAVNADTHTIYTNILSPPFLPFLVGWWDARTSIRRLLHACIYIHIYIYIHTYIHIHVHICPHTHTHTHIYINTHTSIRRLLRAERAISRMCFGVRHA